MFSQIQNQRVNIIESESESEQKKNYMKEKECHLLVCHIENLYKLIKYYRIQGKNYLANVFMK